MNEIQVFNHEQFGEIRMIMRKGEPWFVGKDMASALGYADAFGALKKHVDDEDKQNCQNDSFESPRGLTIINESGMYSLILSSKLEGAKAFKRWVTSEVLPSIRKTGAYMTDHVMDAILNGDTTMENVLAQLIDERNKRRALEEQVESAIPKVLFANAVAQSEHDIYVGEMAKILHRKGIHNIGEQRLFKWLMEHGWLMRRKGRSSKYIPTQKAIERGYMRIKELVVHGGEGKISVFKTPLITGKGQLFFTDQILRPIHERGQLAINWN